MPLPALVLGCDWTVLSESPGPGVQPPGTRMCVGGLLCCQGVRGLGESSNQGFCSQLSLGCLAVGTQDSPSFMAIEGFPWAWSTTYTCVTPGRGWEASSTAGQGPREHDPGAGEEPTLRWASWSRRGLWAGRPLLEKSRSSSCTGALLVVHGVL